MTMLTSMWGHLLMFGGSMIFLAYFFATQLAEIDKGAEAMSRNYFKPLIGTEAVDRLVSNRPAPERKDVAA